MLDIFIIVILLFGALLGFKRGIIKQSVVTVGMVLIIMLSFILKNPVSSFMYHHFPFFSFDGLYEDIAVLNILLYEAIAFFIVFSILSTILVIVIKISNSFDKILKLTFIFALPSRILGAVLGAIEYYLLIFIALFILMQPMVGLSDSELFKNSKMKDFILEKTPFVSNYVGSTLDTIEDINIIVKDKKKTSVKDFNCKITKIMLKNKILEQESLDYLYKSGKIKYKCKKGD